MNWSNKKLRYYQDRGLEKFLVSRKFAIKEKLESVKEGGKAPPEADRLLKFLGLHRRCPAVVG